MKRKFLILALCILLIAACYGCRGTASTNPPTRRAAAFRVRTPLAEAYRPGQADHVQCNHVREGETYRH